MKRILITGKSSYVGTSFETWIKDKGTDYEVESISVRNESWKDLDFSVYDVILHTVGIAHRKETTENKELYYQINRDLAFEVAKKAKREGIKQFIFFSSMSVYGIDTGVIKKSTPLRPKSNYGKSKLEAEKLIAGLESDNFKVVILRPPMIYGKGCKGNYVRLSQLAMITPVFPKVNNKRSMIFVDNLSEFIRLNIDGAQGGVFHPQNEEYVCTSDMVRMIALLNGTKVRMTRSFNPLLKLIQFNTITKVFGDLVYDSEIDDLKSNYTTCDFKKSIQLTEK